MVHWNDQADAKLFACVLKTHGVKLDMPRLAAAMTEALGEDVTAKALMHRFAKLRSVASEGGDGTTGPGTAGTKASPSKPATPRKRKARAPEDTDDDEDGAFSAKKKTPAKTPAKTRTPRAKKVKLETQTQNESQSQSFANGDVGFKQDAEEKKLGVKVEDLDAEGPFGYAAVVSGGDGEDFGDEEG